MMSHLSRHNATAKIVFFIFVVFLKTLAMGMGKIELLGELSNSGREELMDWGGYGEEKLSTVVITGKLLCHAHKSSIHPLPVSGALVGVFCGKTKKSRAKGSTNNYGEFLIDLPSHLHAIPNLEKICMVKVLNLPKSSPCRNGFTGKHKEIIKLTSIGEGIRIYSTHNVHLMTKHLQAQRKRGGKSKNTVSIL